MKNKKWYDKQFAIISIIVILSFTWYFIMSICFDKKLVYETQFLGIAIGFLITSGILNIAGLFFDKNVK